MRNIRERKRQRLLKARTIRLPNIGYMPRKAKMSETMDRIRRARSVAEVNVYG